jgi:ABC-type molybdate transport system substrate-binding protein
MFRNVHSPAMRCLLLGLLIAAMVIGTAHADDLTLYGAGSLREAIGQIAHDFSAAHGVTVKTRFGPSGRMRERIESGEKVDVFTSADVGHARKLVIDGRADLMVVFARNTLCLLAPTRLGLRSNTVLDYLLTPGIRIGISPPKADPLGDYTMKLFDVAEKLQPGSGANLQAKAVIIDNSPGAPPSRSGDTDVDAFQDKKIDVDIVYCSGHDRYARLLPDAAMVAFPPPMQIGPEYGLAVMKNVPPTALLLALTILSPTGQEALARHGFRTVTMPND